MAARGASRSVAGASGSFTSWASGSFGSRSVARAGRSVGSSRASRSVAGTSGSLTSRTSWSVAGARGTYTCWSVDGASRASGSVIGVS